MAPEEAEGGSLDLKQIQNIEVFLIGNAESSKVAFDFKDRQVFLRSDNHRSQ